MTTFLISLVIILHVGFFILESLLWTRPAGRKIFGTSEEQARQTAVMAANQGLYNGFLAAGLLWSLLNSSQEFSRSLQIFFLSCVVIAGIFGAATANRKILFVQALPAVIPLVLLLLN